jgi:hypothetical protein
MDCRWAHMERQMDLSADMVREHMGLHRRGLISVKAHRDSVVCRPIAPHHSQAGMASPVLCQGRGQGHTRHRGSRLFAPG